MTTDSGSVDSGVAHAGATDTADVGTDGAERRPARVTARTTTRASSDAPRTGIGADHAAGRGGTESRGRTESHTGTGTGTGRPGPDVGDAGDGGSNDATAADAADAGYAADARALDLARRERYAALTDRCHRLVRFLHEVAVSQSEQIVDVDENPLVIWLAGLPSGLSLFEAAGAGEVLLEAPAAALLPPAPPLPEILRGRVRLPVRGSEASAGRSEHGIVLHGPVPPADVDLSAAPLLVYDLPAVSQAERAAGHPTGDAGHGDDQSDRDDAARPGDAPSGALNGSSPTSNGAAPSSNGKGPSSNGSAPSANGTAPSTNGTAPSANGSAPTSNGSGPASKGGSPTSNGRRSNGTRPRTGEVTGPRQPSTAGAAGNGRAGTSGEPATTYPSATPVPADVAAAFAEWARAWQVWSSRARADADRRHLHTTLYGVAQRLAQEGDTLELVLATGLLTWKLPRPVRRHLLVTRLVVETDPMTSAIRLRVPAGTSTRLEDSAFLDRVPAFRPERTNALHERLRSRDAAPLGADDERLLRDWLTLAVDGPTEGYRPNWPPPGPAGPSASLTLAPALILRSRGHAALLNYYEQMLDALRGDGLPPLGLAQLVETLDTSERLAWLATAEGAEPGRLALAPRSTGTLAGPTDSTGSGSSGSPGSPDAADAADADVAGDWLSPLPISPEQTRVMRRLRLDNGVVVEGPPGTGKTHTIANLISALLAEGRRVLVTSQKGQALRVLQEKLPPELRRLCVSLTEDAESGAGELATSVSALAAQKAVYDAGSQDERIRTARQRRDSAVSERERIATAVAARRAAEWRRHGTYEVGAGWSGTRAEIAARLRDEASEHGWIPVPVPGPEGGGWPRPPLNDSEAAELWRLLTTPDPVSSAMRGFGGPGQQHGGPGDPSSAPTTPLRITIGGRLVRTIPATLPAPPAPPVLPAAPVPADGQAPPAQPGQSARPGQPAQPGHGGGGAGPERASDAAGAGRQGGPSASAGTGTPAGQAGQAVGAESTGPSDPPTVPSPITSAIALSALREQRAFGLPPELGELPTRSELTALAYAEQGALHAAETAEQALSRQAAAMVPVLAHALALAGDEAADRLAGAVDGVLRAAEIIARLAVRQPWAADALADAFAGRAAVLWTKVAAAAPAIAEATAAVVELGLHQVELPRYPDGRGPDAIALLSSAIALREHMDAGGTLRRFFRSKAQKDARVLLEETSVDGVPPRTPELLDLALFRLRAEVALDAATRAWSLLSVAPDPSAELEVRLARLTEAQDVARAIDVAVAARGRLAALLDALGAHGIPLDSPTACFDVGAAANAYRLRQAATAAGTGLRDLTAELVAAAAQPDAVDELALLAMAVEARDPAGYVAALEATADALNGRARARRRDELLGRVREAHPVLADLLQAGRLFAGQGAASHGTPGQAGHTGQAGQTGQGGQAPTGPAALGELFESFGKAWSHAVAATWLARVRATDQADLDADLDAADELVASATAELAGSLAWKHCLERMGTEQSAALRAYADAMAAGGRFTGRHAERYRQAAREAMRIAQTAVPAWVMPISEVLSTIPAVRDSFDVVIVDEGSQAGLESLFLLWLAPRVIVVGDDRQCTPPDASAEELEPVFNRLDTLLPDIPSWLRVGFTPRSSLFSLLRTRFGDVVRLREHFRCMPEIIEWSSAMFYRDAPLIPLRQFGVDRLTPLRAQYVPHAYTTPTAEGPRNPVEAEALVTQVLKCAEDPRYRGLTFGIVVLQGSAQAELIRSELVSRMSAAEQQRRRLRVGSPPDFQGDERDVIFLSLVVAPGTSTTSLTRLEYQRRFNVAASRARDQVWLFHSVSASDLDPVDLRHSYLSYVLAHSGSTPTAISAAPVAASEVSPVLPHPRFDSLFEQRVFLALATRGYHVTPQVEINGRRFDLVVSGGRARLAVECDGDTTRSTDDVERDLTRERELRRVGWRIWRIRRSEFEIDPEAALAPLWPRLAAAGILPIATPAHLPVTPNHPDPAMHVTQLLTAPEYASPVPAGTALPSAPAPRALPPGASATSIAAPSTPATPAPATFTPAGSTAAAAEALSAAAAGSVRPESESRPAPRPAGDTTAPGRDSAPVRPSALPVPEPRDAGRSTARDLFPSTPGLPLPSVGGTTGSGTTGSGTTSSGAAGAWSTSGGSPTGWASVGTSPSGFPAMHDLPSGPDQWSEDAVSPGAPVVPDASIAAVPTGGQTDAGPAASVTAAGGATGGTADADDPSSSRPSADHAPAASDTAGPGVASVHADPDERRQRWRPIQLSELEGLDDVPPTAL
ncbi:AAA domain-containing protein [Parafrankia irregularis]|uniref:AAA domain-containing protein n=1 Tax=Parafrankia irregularis TaxID=795642 RepID=A0A0S4QUJ1_9ACTN|nr:MULTISPECIES: AAA domain-containing protein [Parafrankia]MBE3205241.1 AAA family ATPase [Parafrankia sp. CH37]CUU58799.1 AAA domain-containing protein [Parafrankia irregularis]